jgi:hypothetical protein
MRFAGCARLYNPAITQPRHPTSTGNILIGRDRELSAFDALLGSLDIGESAVVALAGEPGVGKTALIGKVLERGRSRGYRTLRARASEFERDLPFAAFADALESAVYSLAPVQRGLVDSEQLALLATVFPSLAHDLGGGRRVTPIPMSVIWCCVRFMGCWSSWRMSALSCLRSTICSGLIQHRSIWCAACFTADSRAAHCCCSLHVPARANRD